MATTPTALIYKNYWLLVSKTGLPDDVVLDKPNDFATGTVVAAGQVESYPIGTTVTYFRAGCPDGMRPVTITINNVIYTLIDWRSVIFSQGVAP